MKRTLLTRAISHAVQRLVELERPDAVVSYADPNVGHLGGVYRAASWVDHGQSDESRVTAGRVLPPPSAAPARPTGRAVLRSNRWGFSNNHIYGGFPNTHMCVARSYSYMQIAIRQFSDGD